MSRDPMRRRFKDQPVPPDRTAIRSTSRLIRRSGLVPAGGVS